MDMKNLCRNGDIFMAELPEDTEGSIQAGERPVIVVSNNLCNRFSPVINVLPITSSRTKAELPVHVSIEGCGLWESGIVLAEQITSINKWSLLEKMGSIRQTRYERGVREAIEIQLNLLRRSTKAGYIT